MALLRRGVHDVNTENSKLVKARRRTTCGS